MTTNKTLSILFLLLLCTGLASCDNNSGAKHSAVKLEGTAVKGVIKHAAVSLFLIIDGKVQEQPIARSSTDENGHYSIDTVTAHKGPALLRVTGQRITLL